MANAADSPSGRVKDQAGRRLGPRAIETRQRLLDATLQLLDERSVLEISVAEIARRVGSAPSLFYHYFKDVEEAAREIAAQAAAETPALVAAIEGGFEGEEGLRRARDLVQAHIAHWERYRGALLLRNQAADRGDPSFHRIRRNALGPLIDELRDVIEASQQRGRVAQDLHPYLAASGLVSILESLAAHAGRMQRFGASKKQLVDTCARMVYSTVNGSG